MLFRANFTVKEALPHEFFIAIDLFLWFTLVFIAAKLQAERSYIAVLLVFLQFKEFELFWGAFFFFKICSHIS